MKETEDSRSDSSTTMTEATDLKPPIRRRSSLTVHWPPPRHSDPRADDSQRLESAVKQAISVAGLVPDNDDSSICSSSYHFSSPSKIRVRRDCPVIPGSVQNRLSAIISAYSPSKQSTEHHSTAELSPSNWGIGDALGRTTGEVPLPPVFAMINNSPLKDSPARNLRSSVVSLPVSPAISLENCQERGTHAVGNAHPVIAVTVSPPNGGKTATRTYLRRKKDSKLKNKWPPATKQRQTVKDVHTESQKRRSRAAEELQTINRSGFKETRSLFENLSTHGSSAKACAGSMAMVDRSEHSRASPFRRAMKYRTGLGKETDSERAKNGGKGLSVVRNENLSGDSMHNGTPTHGVWVVERGFAGGQSNSSFCYDEWETYSETESFGADDAPAPIDEDFSEERSFADNSVPSGEQQPPSNGQNQSRRTNYRISYEGPTHLRIQLPEEEDGINLSGLAETRPPRSDDESNCNASDESLSEDMLDTTRDPHRIRGCNRPDIWITPLKSSDGSRKWKVKRVWDVAGIDEEEPEYEIDQADLMMSIRDLLGVPDECGITSNEWGMSMGDANKWDKTTNKDEPPKNPRNGPFCFKTFYDVDGEFDGSESSISLDEGCFINKMTEIAESADHENVIEEVEHDYRYQGGPKQRAFHRPDNWLSPQGSSMKASGPRSWKAKAVQPTPADQISTDREDDLDSSMEEKVSCLDTSHSNESASEISDELPSPELSPLSTRVSYRTNGYNFKNSSKVHLDVLPKRNLQQRDCEEKPVRGIPTWQKEASGKPKVVKEPVKLWWEE